MHPSRGMQEDNVKTVSDIAMRDSQKWLRGLQMKKRINQMDKDSANKFQKVEMDNEEPPKYWSSTLKVSKDYGFSHDYIMKITERLLKKLPMNFRGQFHPDLEGGIHYYGMDTGAFVNLAIELGLVLLTGLQRTFWRGWRSSQEMNEVMSLEDKLEGKLYKVLQDILYFGPGKQMEVGTEEYFHQKDKTGILQEPKRCKCLFEDR